MPRRFPLIQFPNRAMGLAMLAGLIARVTDGQARRAATVAARLAMLVWAAQEIRTGANWFRRLLGLGIGSRHARALVRRLGR